MWFPNLRGQSIDFMFLPMKEERMKTNFLFNSIIIDLIHWFLHEKASHLI